MNGADLTACEDRARCCSGSIKASRTQQLASSIAPTNVPAGPFSACSGRISRSFPLSLECNLVGIPLHPGYPVHVKTPIDSDSVSFRRQYAEESIDFCSYEVLVRGTTPVLTNTLAEHFQKGKILQ